MKNAEQIDTATNWEYRYMTILKDKTIFITGAAGFIGANLVTELMKTDEPITIIGLDNMNDYYDVSLKEYRLSEIEKITAEIEHVSWKFIKGDLADKALIVNIFDEYKPDIVVNLAAQAGCATRSPIPTLTYRAI